MHRLAAAAALCLSLPLASFAQDRATTKEAEMMVHRGVEFLKANGKEKAIATFSDSKGQFTYRDLYIVVLDLGGVVRAHGTRPDLIGKANLDAKDADGKAWNREIIATAKSKGKGWVEYKFPNPVTKAVEQKVAYFELQDDLIVLCGAFLKG
jgi:signal transduction histidine kinase